MRCLIIGGDGMLGHRLLLDWRRRHDVRVTVRRSLVDYRAYNLFCSENCFDGIDVAEPRALDRVFAEFRPEAVVNAAGVIKQRKDTTDARQMLEVNAVFPRRLLSLCREYDSRLVHLSTDCVFNGHRGNYRQDDLIDAEDVYGLSKYLGELAEAPAVTLRSSIIGLELSRKASLIEWFLAQRGKIKGFTRAIYTGLTTNEMSRVIESMLGEHHNLYGLWQVAAEPITKFALLTKLAQKLGREDILLEPDASFHCDRSLDGSAFTAKTGYRAPSWDAMLQELAEQIQPNRVHARAS
jgi:dTDP-4-dehydrorhamnose reductase